MKYIYFPLSDDANRFQFNSFDQSEEDNLLAALSDHLNALNGSSDHRQQQHQSNETIYANSNAIQMKSIGFKRNELNASIPIGRKPALPPKPSTQVETIKKCISAPIKNGFGFQKPKPKLPMKSTKQKDPAEMSLKERLALFEQNKNILIVPKVNDGIVTLPRKISTNSSITDDTKCMSSILFIDLAYRN